VHLVAIPRSARLSPGRHPATHSPGTTSQPQDQQTRSCAKDSDVVRIVRGGRCVDRRAEARETAHRHASRALPVSQDEAGMLVL